MKRNMKLVFIILTVIILGIASLALRHYIKYRYGSELTTPTNCFPIK